MSRKLFLANIASLIVSFSTQIGSSISAHSSISSVANPERVKYGITSAHAHLTEEMFKRIYLKGRSYAKRKGIIHSPRPVIGFENKTIVPFIDWREEGVISAVKSQDQCGACWALSVLDTIESLLQIEQNTTASLGLSVQQMIDCSTGNDCTGGNSRSLVQWLVDEQIEIYPNSVYPETTAHYKEQCRMTELKPLLNSQVVKVKSFTAEDLSLNEDKILKYLSQGPVVASVNAVSWQYYVEGIIQYHCDNAPDLMNHVVQIVGYSRNTSIPYYIVKNSWGKHFGENGYLRIAIGGNVCGIANQVITLGVSKQ